MRNYILIRSSLRCNSYLERRMFLVTGIGLLLGAIFHETFATLKPLVPYIFAYMTLTVAINCSPKSLLQTLAQPKLLLLNLLLLHLAIPLLGKLLSSYLLAGEPLLQAGIIMGVSIPIGVAANIWVSIAGGNIPFTLTTVMIDTLLAPVILPLTIHWGVGRSINYDSTGLILGLLWMIVLPTLIGVTLNKLTTGKIARDWRFVTSPSSKLLLALVVAVNLAVARDSLQTFNTQMLRLIITVFLLSCLGYLIGYLVARILKFSPSTCRTFTYTVGIRNITAGLVLALQYFPKETAIPVVFATICQQPLAALSYRWLNKKPTKSK